MLAWQSQEFFILSYEIAMSLLTQLLAITAKLIHVTTPRRNDLMPLNGLISINSIS